MIALVLALTLQATEHRSSADANVSQIAGVNIVGGKLSDLIRRIGRGESVVRNYSPFRDGWTSWKVGGRKDELLTVNWNPASPKSRRRIDRIVIDRFPTQKRFTAADPRKLEFWGTIRLGETPAELTKQLLSIGKPARTSASHLSWKTKAIEISAAFENGHLYSIAAQEPTIDDPS